MTTTTVRWGAVTVDCLDPGLLAEFWAAMLDTSIGGRWGDQYVHLERPPTGPGLAFQRVASKAPGKNTLHLDLHVQADADVAPVVERALALGAQLLRQVEQAGIEWVVLLDPEQNQFCVVAAEPPPH